MSDALRRIADAMTDVTEAEMVDALRALGVAVSERRRTVVAEVPRTPLPTQGGPSNVHSEVEWV
ncbi:hypothetical protein [Streptomyces sp. GS7]|uniref:hypothetical protein n=1 Tax=Streptomyces sp. GS7 TaxID=2692234 RepID=UPI001317DD0C|nr:hypothetical protein [Streptomyces sp. GS7]QHC23480.1 hypothetical protein GR130_20955 [Streptomyces sp. GS7]